MHFSIRLAVAAAVSFASFTTCASAQTAAPTTSSFTPATDILSIAMPPNARLRFDIDARDEDMLGVVKSLLRGFKGQSLKQLLQPVKTADGKPAPPVDLEKAAALTLLSDANLETLLRDVKHLRIVGFETPYNWAARYSGKPVKPTAQSTIAFYEQAYLTREGGRRLVRADFDDFQLLTAGFPGRGFAIVVQGPGFGGVLRADGYPDLEGIGPLVMGSALQMSSVMRHSR